MADRTLCVIVLLTSMQTTYIEGTLRLIGGDDQYEGRLEIYYNGEWESICNDYWSTDNSRVACKQLGLKGGYHRDTEQSEHGDGTFWFKRVECLGSETLLDNCVSTNDTSGECKHSHRDYIYLTCEPPIDGVLRLQGGRIQSEGRLEIYHDEKWGTVCDDKWSDHPQNAQVACRQLGYKSGTHRKVYSNELASSIKTWMDNVECLGNETRIQECPFNGWGDENCFHEEDIYLKCDEHKGNLTRLVGGVDEYEGRLEVYHAGQWGSVCIDQWDKFVLNAHVACRQLGYTAGSFRLVTTTEQGKGPFWMDDIECNGDEVNLFDCNFKGWGSTKCSHAANNDVFLQCIPNKGDIKLAEGTNPFNGLVQVFFKGNWVTVCADDWSNDNLEVTCRQLGTVGKSSGKANFVGYYLAGDFKCDGSEEYLAKCSYFTGQCSSDEKVFVNCEIPVSTLNGMCDINLQDTCNTTLTCKDVNGFGRCICDSESFWDVNTNRCEEKIMYNDVCDPNVDSVCSSNLTCERVNAPTSFLYKCICSDENDVWDNSIRGCRGKTGLRGIYVADKRNITDAISDCTKHHEGQLASDEHLRNVLQNCLDFADDIWVIEISFSRADNLSDSCAEMNQNGELKTGGCTEERAFVCISQKNNQTDSSCAGFPTVTKSKSSTSISAGLIGGIIAVCIILSVFVILGIGLLCRRRRKCEKEADCVLNSAYGLQDSSIVGSLQTEGETKLQYSESYANALEKAEIHVRDSKHSNIYINNNAGDIVTEEQYEIFGDNDRMYALSDATPEYENYTNDTNSTKDVLEDYSLSDSINSPKSTNTNYRPLSSTDNLPEEEYNTFANQLDDLPPSDTYDHVHDVAEDGYDQFQPRSSNRSNFTEDDETGYMQSTFPECI
ncbi:deleted in malignant brain tumors 1 protein-like [Ylistrum balloti]|uniref:deleted in malignant brain tumors 1 protein-like n=1 Tax=Ylistrum balloti TaxID=509963 RepID=UPI0029059889|nr:deleted in malignant brain tumors 1 protein-like [Ylistrum balloti]